MVEREPPVVVSACLAGIGCRYDGKDNTDPRVMELVRNGNVILVCPEQMGGLPTPRPASGRDGDRVITLDGTDVTNQFNAGAEAVVKLAELNGCKKAILKARSPSCGIGKCIGIEKLRGGDYQNRDGVTAEKLRTLGLELQTEEEL
jgi:uncharacterized protein YbbK (DUF523 family)